MVLVYPSDVNPAFLLKKLRNQILKECAHMGCTKVVNLYSKIARSLVLLFIAIFLWQSLTNLTFASATTTPADNKVTQGKHKIHNHTVPALPETASTYFYQGLSYYDHGRWYEAIASFQEAISIRPEYAVAYFSLGTVYSRIGSWKEALASFKTAVEISPDYAEGYLGLGVAYVILGRNDEAVEACKKAIRLRPGYAKAHFALALNYLMLGDSESALREYETLKTLDKDLANQLIHLIDW
jgi:tetratricopeptide (TPR) repeat protein